MRTLSLNSFDFCTEDQVLRITVSWDNKKFPNPDFNQKLNINNSKNITEVKAYELDSKQLEFAETHHLPFKHTYYSLEDLHNFIILLEEYEELITEAEAFRVDWDFTKFDFEGLKEAVEQEIRGRSSKE